MGYVKSLGGATTESETLTFTLVLTAAMAAGNQVVLPIYSGGGFSAVSVADSKGNTWKIVGNSGGEKVALTMAYSLIDKAALVAGDTITATFSGEKHFGAMMEALEYSGISGVTAFAFNNAASVPIEGSIQSGPVKANAGDLLFAGFVSNKATIGYVAPAGYAELPGLTSEHIMVCRRLEGVAAGEYNPQWKWTSRPPNTNVGVFTVAFTVASGSEPVDLTAALTGEGAAATDLQALASLDAQLQGVGDLSGALRPAAALAAALLGTADLSVEFSGATAELRAALLGEGAAVGNLDAVANLGAGLLGDGTATADLRHLASLTAVLAANGMLSGNLGQLATLRAALLGEGSATGRITPLSFLSAALVGGGDLAAALALVLGGGPRLTSPASPILTSPGAPTLTSPPEPTLTTES